MVTNKTQRFETVPPAKTAYFDSDVVTVDVGGTDNEWYLDKLAVNSNGTISDVKVGIKHPKTPLTSIEEWTFGSAGAGSDVIYSADTGNVYASDGTDLHAVDAVDGTEQWKVVSIDPFGQIRYDSINDHVYAVSGSSNEVIASTSAPGVAWRFGVQNAILGSLDFDPDHEQVYAADDTGILYAINASDGSKAWDNATGKTSEAGILYESTNQQVYFGNNDEWFAFDHTGTQQWSYDMGGGTTGLTSPLGYDPDNNHVYGGGFGKAIRAVDAVTGAEQWVESLGGANSLESGIAYDPVNGNIFYGTDDNKIRAHDAASGSLVWEFTTNDSVDSDVIYANGRVYAGNTGNGTLYALGAADGSLVWDFSATNAIDNGVAYDPDNNQVYATTKSNTLHAVNESASIKVENTARAATSSPSASTEVLEIDEYVASGATIGIAVEGADAGVELVARQVI